MAGMTLSGDLDDDVLALEAAEAAAGVKCGVAPATPRHPATPPLAALAAGVGKRVVGALLTPLRTLSAASAALAAPQPATPSPSPRPPPCVELAAERASRTLYADPELHAVALELAVELAAADAAAPPSAAPTPGAPLPASRPLAALAAHVSHPSNSAVLAVVARRLAGAPGAGACSRSSPGRCGPPPATHRAAASRTARPAKSSPVACRSTAAGACSRS